MRFLKSCAGFLAPGLRSVTTPRLVGNPLASSLSTVNSREVDYFDQQSAVDWWDQKHPFWALQKYNAIRVPFITRQIALYGDKPLKQCRLLDVGCGGGYLSEALAKAGATVTGIDVSQRALEVRC